MSLYSHPYEPDAYTVEPSDDQATCLARALAHWCSAYPERTVAEIIEDILACNGASSSMQPMSRDECVAIAHACGVPAAV